MKLFYLLKILLVVGPLAGCKSEQEKEQLNSRVTISLNAKTNAKTGQPGVGEFVVSSSEDIKVTCTNCGPQLQLSFTDRNADGSSQIASFQFPFVEKTYLCKLNLAVEFSSGKKSQSIDYGLYLCPTGVNGNSQCDLSNALETCRLN